MASALETVFSLQLQALGVPGAHREHRFAQAYGRQWRFDYAWPDRMLAVEIEGGTWNRGRHTRGTGYAEDCLKYNTAVILGWRVLRYTAASIDDWSAAKEVADVLRKSMREDAL